MELMDRQGKLNSLAEVVKESHITLLKRRDQDGEKSVSVSMSEMKRKNERKRGRPGQERLANYRYFDI